MGRKRLLLVGFVSEGSEGAPIDARQTEVVAKCGEEVMHVAARANGGPWRQGAIRGGQAVMAVDLSFGDVNLAVMAVNKGGVRATVARRVSCTKQATAAATSASSSASPIGIARTGPRSA